MTLIPIRGNDYQRGGGIIVFRIKMVYMQKKAAKKKVSKKKTVAKKTGTSPVIPIANAENICDQVHRVIKAAKKETPAIRSLKQWYGENC